MRIDWRAIRFSVLGTLGAAMLCQASLWGSGWFSETQLKELQRQERALREMNHRHDSAATEVASIAADHPRFEAYKKQGIIGGEDRAAWARALAHQARARRLIQLRYSIAPPIPFSLPRFGKLVGADLVGSVMSLDMGLIHEGEMIDLIAGLDDESPGLFHVNECSLERKNKGQPLDMNGRVANLSARCQLIWFTIKGASSDWGGGF
ncbi:MAG: hypothetical protein HQL76_15565 [Magnetococcales bacterium]|nr:hypothetical protein [Magnetococcales bacterium]